MFISFSTALLNGMEKETETISLLGMTKTSLSLKYNGTKINLVKGSWEDATDTINFTVVGNQQQHMLQNGKFSIAGVGEIYYSSFSCTSVYKRKKDDESASDDDTYKPHRQIDKQTWEDRQKVKQSLLRIEEPCIKFITKSEKPCISPLTQGDMDQIKEYMSRLNESELEQAVVRLKESFDTYIYDVHRAMPNAQDNYYTLCFKGDEAIKEASKDLSLCYTNALTKGLKCLEYSEKKNKSLAFPTLGADVGFPRDKAAPIAILAVFNFLQDYSNQYESINFFVKKRSEFALYKKLLMEYYKPIRVIYLLYWMHKDAEQDFSCLPKDMIDYIVRLMCNLSI